MGAAASALVFAAGTAEAQIPVPGPAATALGPFTLSDRAHNPLRPGTIRDIHNKPTAVDLDKDGDLDLAVGTSSGSYRYFRNDGTATNPLYVELLNGNNPLNAVSGWSAAAFADIDKDGDLDMFVGEEFNDMDSPTYGSIHYIVNQNGKFWTELTPGEFVPNEQKGPYNVTTKAGNPVNLLIYDTHVMPEFVDLDKDGDQDLIVSYDIDAEPTAVSYFLNDGNGNFSQSTFLPNTTRANEDLNFGDVDGDGDQDMVIGDIDGGIYFYSNNGSGTFTEQTGTWDGSTKTGNPFDQLQPHAYNSGFLETSLALGDFNGDGKVDAMIGFNSGPPAYAPAELMYFLQNNGQGNFQRVNGLLDPLGGVETMGLATVDFKDINGDGQPDAIVSGSGANKVDLYFNFNGTFSLAPDASNPFSNTHLGSLSNGAAGQLVDFDKDGDLDFISSNTRGDILYFKNDNGTYALQPNGASNPFDTSDLNFYSDDEQIPGVPAFVDIDADGDLDLFIGSKYGYIDFFRNDGGVLNKQGARDGNYDPVDNLNPMGNLHVPRPYYHGASVANIRFVDLDNDGDYDALVGHSSVTLDSDGFNVVPNSIIFFENTGPPTTPSFIERMSPFKSEDLYGEPLLKFIDFDNDGDQDAFVGHQEDDGYQQVGRFDYFVNTNPAPVVTGVANVPVQGNNTIILDPNMTLTDQDNDVINQVLVTIQNFNAGKEVITFTPKAPVTGSFNSTTGVLTLSGKGTVADYNAVLRTISYQYTASKSQSGGRKPSESSKTISLNRTLSVVAQDADKTAGTPKVFALQISFPNSTPSLASSGTPVLYSSAPIAVDVAVTITDADDSNMAGATIMFDPSKYVAAEDVLDFVNQNGISGTFSSATGTLALTGISSVTNYQAALRSVSYRNSSSKPTQGDRIVLFSITDGESISNTTSNTVTLQITDDLVVFNALSPNSDNLNPLFFIQNIETLEPSNKVTIFNRWGDKIFEARDYNNTTNAFRGQSTSGGELPGGVYFYVIEFLGTSGRPRLEGYLSIRR